MIEITLKTGEAKEPLDDTHSIIQCADGYRFGSDAVALAKFACEFITDGERVFDLCSGCGIVGILIAIEKNAHIVGAELDADLCDMSRRSAVMNELDATFYNADVRTPDARIFERGGFSAAVCNPPFYKADSKPRKIAPTASSELTVTFRDIARTAAEILGSGGKFFFVHTTARLDEILSVCNEFGLTPKTVAINANGKTFLCRAVKGAKPGMTAEVKEY